MGRFLETAVLPAITIFDSASTGVLEADGNALSGPFDPTTTAFGGSGPSGSPANSGGYQRCRFTLMSGSTPLDAAPPEGQSYEIWFRLPVDGTLTLAGDPTVTWQNDPGRTTKPNWNVACVATGNPNSTTQNLVFDGLADIPECPFEVILFNPTTFVLGTGLVSTPLPAGWSLLLTPVTDQID